MTDFTKVHLTTLTLLFSHEMPYSISFPMHSGDTSGSGTDKNSVVFNLSTVRLPFIDSRMLLELKFGIVKHGSLMIFHSGRPNLILPSKRGVIDEYPSATTTSPISGFK